MKKTVITIEFIQNLLDESKYDFNNGWFYPSDLIPHSGRLKYACKKLHLTGLLERDGDNTDRWGYRYKIKNNQ